MKAYIQVDRSKVVWSKFDNQTGEITLHHCMKSVKRREHHAGTYTCEMVDGNVSLCGKISIMDHNENYLSIDEIERSALDKKNGL